VIFAVGDTISLLSLINIVEGCVRIELFAWRSITVAIVVIPVGAFMTVLGVWVFLVSPPSQNLFGPGFLVVWIALVAGFTIWVAVTPWLRKRSKTRPLIIIDDAGLWLRRVGELMPWSEIQSVEWRVLHEWRVHNPGINFGGTRDIVVVWKHEQYSLAYHGHAVGAEFLMDRDDKLWGPYSLYKEIKAHWEQDRAGSAA
jgi:hypothetical protein